MKVTINHTARIRTARSRQTAEAITAGWLYILNSTHMTITRSRQSAEAIEADQLHAGCCGLNEPPDPGEQQK